MLSPYHIALAAARRRARLFAVRRRERMSTPQPQSAPPRPYRVQELAKRWGVSSPVIVRAIKAGSLPAFRVGRTWLIHAGPVDRLSEEPTA
jgi:excisionase family DNA binding protein